MRELRLMFAQLIKLHFSRWLQSVFICIKLYAFMLGMVHDRDLLRPLSLRLALEVLLCGLFRFFWSLVDQLLKFLIYLVSLLKRGDSSLTKDRGGLSELRVVRFMILGRQVEIRGRKSLPRHIKRVLHLPFKWIWLRICLITIYHLLHSVLWAYVYHLTATYFQAMELWLCGNWLGLVIF